MRWLWVVLVCCGVAAAQDATEPMTTLKAGTSLVLVPAMVRTKAGAPVFTLQAKDFVVTDDGVPQAVRLEEDTGSQPLALVVVIQDGGDGASKFDVYGTLGTMIDALVGGVEHKVAVVAFDSEPDLVQPFTADLDKVNGAIHKLEPEDGKDAILDALKFSVDLLGKQPVRYRRAILLVSETLDHGSHLELDEAIRSVSNTNTVVYGLGFSSSRAENRREMAEMSGGAGSKAMPEHGCMGSRPEEPGVAKQNKGAQAYDCLSDLLPPLRLAKMAAIAARNAFRTNVPEAAARLTGGEYFHFENAKGMEKSLGAISNRLPNRYFLSFQPTNPHLGLHAIAVGLPEYPQLKVEARKSYWAEGVGR